MSVERRGTLEGVHKNRNTRRRNGSGEEDPGCGREHRRLKQGRGGVQHLKRSNNRRNIKWGGGVDQSITTNRSNTPLGSPKKNATSRTATPSKHTDLESHKHSLTGT
uniref:Uncharacterized protein n=1 Tax=Octopus bimaculoides TaxID=37653 RepID=A0A0L8G8B4_OCTBM